MAQRTSPSLPFVSLPSVPVATARPASPARQRTAKPPPTLFPAGDMPRRSPMLTVDQVAEHLAISTKTVRRWIIDGRLNVHRFGPQLRISERDLQAFVAQQRR